MKLGSSSSGGGGGGGGGGSSAQDAYGGGDSGRGGPGALTISSVMHDLKEKFKNDEEDQGTPLTPPKIGALR
jgi:hypothetical protein